jgi:hypothetical protein
VRGSGRTVGRRSDRRRDMSHQASTRPARLTTVAVGIAVGTEADRGAVRRCLEPHPVHRHNRHPEPVTAQGS